MADELQPFNIVADDSVLTDRGSIDESKQSEKMKLIITSAFDSTTDGEDKTALTQIADAMVMEEEEEIKTANTGSTDGGDVGDVGDGGGISAQNTQTSQISSRISSQISPQASPALSPQISPQSTMDVPPLDNRTNHLNLSPQKVKHQVSRAASMLSSTPTTREKFFQIADSYKDNWREYVKQPVVQDTVEEQELYFADPDTPRRVFTMMKIKRISDVNNADQTYRAKFHIYFDWLLTKDEYEDYLQNKNDYTPDFVPRYDFANIVEQTINEPVSYGSKGPYRVQKLKDFKQELVGFDPNEAYFCRMRIEVDAIFQETFELERYPFDCQDLTVVLREKTGIKQAIFVPELRTLKNGDPSEFVKVDGSISNIDEYDLDNCIVQFGESNAADSKSKTVYSEMYVSIKLARKWRVVLIDTLLVVFLVIILSFAGFAISYEDIADRLAYTLTLMLTAVLFDTNNNPTPYLTFMDKYVLACYVYLTLMMVQNSLAAFSWYSDEVEEASLYVFLAFFVVMHVFFVWRGVSVRVSEMSKLAMSYTEVNEYNDELHSQDSRFFVFSWDDLYDNLKGDKKWIAFKPKGSDDDD